MSRSQEIQEVRRQNRKSEDNHEYQDSSDS